VSNEWAVDKSGPLMQRTKAAELLLTLAERGPLSALDVRKRLKGAHVVLTQRLKEMERAGLVQVLTKDPAAPAQVTRKKFYGLTAKGRRAARILRSLNEFVASKPR
jgi:DNA-binding HxlR family transcriptional regulator